MTVCARTRQGRLLSKVWSKTSQRRCVLQTGSVRPGEGRQGGLWTTIAGIVAQLGATGRAVCGRASRRECVGSATGVVVSRNGCRTPVAQPHSTESTGSRRITRAQSI